MISIFFIEVFVTVAIAVVTLGHILVLHAIFVGPAQDNETPRTQPHTSSEAGAMPI